MQSGRFVDFAVPLQQARTFYAATGSGGLWKTVNNGQTFDPIFDGQEVLSVGAIALAPSDANVLWVGTGEGNPRNSVSFGNGVYRSTDGGDTWQRTLFLSDSTSAIDVAVDPTNGSKVYAAMWERQRLGPA